MIGLTMCSGIGAPEVAAPWVDWRLASEIEKFPRAVLAERFGYRLPEDHNQGDPLLWGDMTEIGPELLRSRGIPLPEIVVAGTPCQAFSVAGLRKGTEDARGNLTLKFVEILHELVAARPDGKLAVLWENVPGVLSDKGNAFGCFLGGIVGSLDALRAPGGGSWPGEGMVQGPRARAAWAVLDAQFFGVAQRRRRVFVVVDFGGACDPAAVLLEPESLRGNPPARGGKGQASAGKARAGAESRGWTVDVAPTLRAGGNATGGDRPPGTDVDTVESLVTSTGETAHCLNAGGMGRCDYETETMIAHSLRGEGFDASEDGTGRGTPIGPVVQGVALRGREGGATAELTGPLCMALRASQGGGDKPHVMAPVAYRTTGNDGVYETGDMIGALNTASDPNLHVISTPWAVRRLTPTECHRLQGFPDDHCAITHRGKPAADGPQYKALGNSMAIPCVGWVLSRMRISMEATRG